jgi:meso-butanediol dehydrogenase / (S,S)-butanediol dehydrogenase / diacetyl reductase
MTTPSAASFPGVTKRSAGRVVLVTGGGDGIGAAICRRFATEGAAVVVADARADTATAVADELRDNQHQSLAIECDVTSESSVQASIAATEERFGRLDVLINNAGIGPLGNVYSHSVEEWDRVFAVNCRGGFLMSKYAIPLIRSSGGGSVLFTASVGGFQGTMRFLAYTASKAAVLQMVRSMALDHGRHGIRVNAVCPGATATPRWVQMAPPIEAEFAAATPIAERIATPQEQAAAFAFLASDDAAFITGQLLTVDGGASLGKLNLMMLEP